MNSNRIPGRICVTTTFDYNYLKGGKTMMKSIRHYTDCQGVDFKVITADARVVRELGAANCHVMTDALRANYDGVQYSPLLPRERYCASWYRYEMFHFQGYDRVICIDSDCLCLADLSYLFSEELSPFDLISVEDHIVSKIFARNLGALEAQGLNLSGLRRRLSQNQIDIQPALLVANPSIVNERWYEKLIYYANTTPFTYSIDEGILNDFIYLMGLKIHILPLEYDYQDIYETQCPEVGVPARPILVHCEGSKPFRAQKILLDPRLHKWYDKWWAEQRR